MRALTASVLVCAFCFAGCSGVDLSAGSKDQSIQHVVDRLYFGRSVPGGSMVSEAEWKRFLADVVTPRFPDGLTVWRAEGQWKDHSGRIVREQSFVLEVMHPGGAEAEKRVEEIRAAYRNRFHQESVLRVKSRAAVSF